MTGFYHPAAIKNYREHLRSGESLAWGKDISSAKISPPAETLLVNGKQRRNQQRECRAAFMVIVETDCRQIVGR